MTPEEEAILPQVSRALATFRDVVQELQTIDRLPVPILVSALGTALGELVGRHFQPGPACDGCLVTVGKIVRGAAAIEHGLQPRDH